MKIPEWGGEGLYAMLILLIPLLVFSIVVITVNSPNAPTPKDFENQRTSIVLSHLKALEPTKSEVVGYIAKSTVEHGLDPILALQVAFRESSYNPRASNKHSSAKGLFQFVDATWKERCTGEVFNYKDNTDCFLKLYPKHKSWWYVPLSY